MKKYQVIGLDPLNTCFSYGIQVTLEILNPYNTILLVSPEDNFTAAHAT
jgi:hypothetical protein